MTQQPTNWLLAALPAEDYQRLSADLILEPLKPRQVLQQRDEPLRLVYFPGRRSLCSLLMPMADGRAAEIALVGPEWLIGVEAALGLRVGMCDAVVHTTLDRSAHAMSVEAFDREFNRREAFHACVTQSLNLFINVLTQSIACSGLHSAQERCCRWLLDAQDRLGTNEIRITHELLATLLGVRRPTVSIAVEGLVRYGIPYADRGIIRIEDRDALAARSCGCYKNLRTSFERLLPVDAAAATATRPQDETRYHAALVT